MQNGPEIVSIVMLFKEIQVPFPKGLSNEQSVTVFKVLLFVLNISSNVSSIENHKKVKNSWHKFPEPTTKSNYLFGCAI